MPCSGQISFSFLKPKLSFTFKTLLILHLCMGQFSTIFTKPTLSPSSRTCLKTSIHQREVFLGHWTRYLFLWHHAKLSHSIAIVSLGPEPWHHWFLRLGAVSVTVFWWPTTATLKEYLLNKGQNKEMDVNHQRQGHAQVKAPGKKVHRLRRVFTWWAGKKAPLPCGYHSQWQSGPLPHGLFEL